MLQSLLSCLGIRRRHQLRLQLQPKLSPPAWHTESVTQVNSPASTKDKAELPYTDEKPSSSVLSPTNATTQTEQQASAFLTTLLHAETPSQVQFVIAFNGVSTLSLKEYFAELVLSGLETAIRNGVVVGKAMRDAVERAVATAVGFAREHPVYCTIIAIGVLVLLTPWVLELLGFAELGPVEGSFAALWQARYAGYVPRRSLFSYFQRLGMVWHH